MREMLENITRHSGQNIDRLLAERLGERYSHYRRLWDAAGPDNIPPFPIHLDFEVNDICNQRCRMCPRNRDTHPNIKFSINKKTILDFKVYQQAIDEGTENGLMSVNLGAFAEPLLHKDIFKMVKYAHQKGVVDSRLITNGLLLDRMIDDIFSSGLVNLFVSIDAFSEQKYREIRGNGFDRVKSGLIKLLKEKKRRDSILPIVRVSFVDMPGNSGEKENFISFWQDKVDMIDIQIYDNYNINISENISLKKSKKWNCLSPWKRLAVLSDGNILPCCNFFGWNIPIGNINDNGLKGAWHSERLKIIRQGILDDSLDNCSVCQRI